MPRPQRYRRICSYPDYWRFAPEGEAAAETVTMTLDELETIRLLDHEGLTQEACAARMEIARTTVTAIYLSARKKLADALINGKNLQISGGSYRLKTASGIPANLNRKGSRTMRIAVTYENGEVFGHFGRTEQFKLYDVKNGEIKSERVIDTNGAGHGALAVFLKQAQVDALICGGIGPGARMALAEAGIELYAGVTGTADEAAKALVEGRLAFDPDAVCEHHGHAGAEGCGRDACGT